MTIGTLPAGSLPLALCAADDATEDTDASIEALADGAEDVTPADGRDEAAAEPLAVPRIRPQPDVEERADPDSGSGYWLDDRASPY